MICTAAPLNTCATPPSTPATSSRPDRAEYIRNQFGGTLGGAIRKDKLFYFADYQGTRMTQGVDTGLISVPSLQDRAGDFSDIASSLTGSVNGQYWANQLSHKLGYTVNPGEPYYSCDLRHFGPVRISRRADPAARLVRARASRCCPIFPRRIMAAMSSPLRPTTRLSATTRPPSASTTPRRWGALAGYYFADDYGLIIPIPRSQGGANVPGFNALSAGRAQLATLSLTTTFGATSVNELRLGYMRTANNVGQPVGGVGPSLASQGFVDSSGKPGIVPLDPRIEGVENVAFNDFTIGVDTTGARRPTTPISGPTISPRRCGRHTVKFGASVHLDQVNINPDAVYNGSFLFQGTETGSDFADFLLGIASSYTPGRFAALLSAQPLRRPVRAGYLADLAQLDPELRTALGPAAALERKIQPAADTGPGQQSVVYPGAPAGLVFPGDPGIPNTLAPTSHTNFAPRIGLAYSPDARPAFAPATACSTPPSKVSRPAS